MTREEKLEAALRLIRDFPVPEQDNMVAANMREIARAALGDLEERRTGCEHSFAGPDGRDVHAFCRGCGAPHPSLGVSASAPVACRTRVHVAGVDGEWDFVCNLPRGHEGYHGRVEETER